MTTYVTKTITAAGQSSDTVFFDGNFNFSVSGTINSGTTITVQRSTDGSNFLDVDTFTSAGEFVGVEPEPAMRYRATCKSGEFSSGSSVVVRFGGVWRSPVS